MKLKAVGASYLLLNVACSACSSNNSADSPNGNGAAAGSGATGSGGSGNGGLSSTAGGKPQVGPLEPAKGTPGVWEEVTSPDMDPTAFSGASAYGVGNIVSDPLHPNDMYVGGYGAIWKSTDYGLKWQKLASNPNPPALALGHVLAIAGTEPATLWMAAFSGPDFVYRSTDGGLTFTQTGKLAERPESQSLYSIVVDPYDPAHLLSGLHEDDFVVESTDAGDTWHLVSGTGWPSGGKSWFPFFVDTGDALGTAKTWFAIAQDGATAIMTSDRGQSWKVPSGMQGLEHPHGTSGFFQYEQSLFVAGIRGPEGNGVYRSTDLGENWSMVVSGSGAIVWGTPNNLYAMWGWACGGCSDGADYQTSPMPGDAWTKPEVPERLVWGPNSVATASDGKQHIMVGSMWATGLWRYVEP